MTIETANNKSGPYDLGNGVLSFPRTFKILDKSHLRVIRILDGQETEIASGFSHTGIGSGEGSVVFTNLTVPKTGQLVLLRAVPNVQASDYSNQSRMPPEQVERDLDLLEMQIQDLKEESGRALKVSASMSKAGPIVPRDGGAIIWDEAAQSFLAGPTADEISGAQGAALVASAAAAAAEDAVSLISMALDTTGILDMSPAIRAYLAARPGAAFRFPGGIVRIDSTINIPSRTSLDLAGTRFDLSNLATGTAAFRAAGTVNATTNLTASVSRGDTTLFVASSSGIIPGGWIKIRSDASFDPDRTNSKLGELARVASVSGLSVTLHAPIADGYATEDAARVEVLEVVERVNIFGNGEFEAANAQNRKAVHLEKAVDCTIKDQVFRRFSDRAIYLQDCSNAGGDGLVFEDFDSPGTGYGISFTDATQDCLFTRITGRRVRHLVATNNTGAGGGIPRRNKIDGFFVDSSAFATGGTGGDAMDTHAASEDIHFHNGIIRGATGCGVNMEGAGGSVVNVDVHGAATHGIYASNFSSRRGRIIIKGCTVRDAAQSGIRVNSGNSQDWEYAEVGAVIERAGAFPFYAGVNSEILAADFDVTVIDSAGSTQIQVQKIRAGWIAATVLRPREPSALLNVIRARDIQNVDIDLIADIDNANADSVGLFIDVATGTTRGVTYRGRLRNAQAQGMAFRVGAGCTLMRFDADGSIVQGFAQIPLFGSGSPEGFVVAPTGSVYHQIDAAPWARHWHKASGAGSAGWVQS